MLQHLLLVLIALAIVVSLQTAGVAVLAAMLVTPAATAYLLTHRLWQMMIIGAVSSVTGLYLFSSTWPQGQPWCWSARSFSCWPCSFPRAGVS